VSSPDELRSYAIDCARLASAATDPHDKARLLNMARAWTDLAERVEKIGQTAANVVAPEVSAVSVVAPEVSQAASAQSAQPE
jgi:hypothetical protein